MYEIRRDGVAITQLDFGRVLAGQTAAPVVVQVVNTGAADWVDVRMSVVQSDAEGGAGSATVGSLVLTADMQSVGPVPVGGSVSVSLGWATGAGATGVASDLAQFNFQYDE